MNNSAMNEMNYYENANDSIKTIERAILAETISFNSLESINGKFFIPSIMPSLEMDNATDKKTNELTKSNYLELSIPGYILTMFMNPKLIPVNNMENIKFILGFDSNEFVIPKGTEFLIEFVGGLVDSELISVIGIYKLSNINHIINNL